MTGLIVYCKFDFNIVLFNIVLRKTLPCSILGALVYLEHTPLTGDHAKHHALGLIFGALGDFLIAFNHGGLVGGAVSFAIGHFFYMVTFKPHIFVIITFQANFAPKVKQVSKGLCVIILAYGAVMNHFFIMPHLMSNPLSTLILMIYSLILCTALVLSASIYFYGTSDKAPLQYVSSKYL